jgi:dTMP kinase
VLEFHKRVREAYLQCAAREPDRFVVVDASKSPEETEARIAAVVERLLAEA